MSALQSGGELVSKSTLKQRGGFLGTLLASIGIPMVLKALTGGGMQNRSYAFSRPPKIPPPTPKKSGTGMQNRPYSDLFLPYNPPPFYGSWSTGTGVVKKKESKRENRMEKGFF